MSGTDPAPGRDLDLDVHGYATRDARPGADVDVAIRQLLDQQADIQARLTALLASAHRRLDPARELDMLRHKVRILESLVDRHGLAPAVPVLSELEEARLLQYRSECLEAACIQHNLDVFEPLRLSADSAPPGFAPWLDRNLDMHDPVLRSARVRDEHGHAVVPRLSSFRCWDERCMHYIYGFATQLDRDNHARLHSSLSKRDSGLSMGTAAPTPLLPEAPELLRHIPGPPARPAVPSSLPPLSLPPHQPRERRDSAVTYTFPSARPGAGRGSIDSDVDPLLPPLKRSRVGRPRLESIGELKLFRDDNPCLRCRAANQECDASQPCTNCLEQPPAGLDEFWSPLGCYRASIPSFVDIFLPGPLSPRQTRTPITPLAQRRTVNEYLQRAYPHLGAVAPVVSASLDFQDGFWWSGQLEQRHVVSANLSDYGQDMASQAPPILCVIASSWNAQDTSCSLLDLLSVSGCLSLNREAEEATYPVLYHAKVLLREVAFFGILQPDPVFRLDTSEAYRPPPEDVDFEEHVRLLHECMIRFLQSLEGHVFRSTPARPREWLAIFYSLCIFSAVKSLLFEIAEASPQNRTVARHYLGFGAGDPRRAMHSAYKALVRLFVSSGPMLLDGGADLSPEEMAFYRNTSQVLNRDAWTTRGLVSSGDFLMNLGESSPEWPVSNGFLKERRTSHAGDDVLVLPPILKPGHNAKRSAPSIQPPSDLFGPRAETAEDEGPQASELGTPALGEQGRARRHTVAEGAGYTPSSGHSFGSPIAPSRFKPTYQRPPLRRVFCNKCIEHPEGFRGEHELRRHTDAKHAALVKRWVCSEPEGPRSPSPQPVVPLSKCKACLTRKHYGAYYNAAAHLRRAHFNPHRGGKASGDWPPMTILKDWMREVRQPIDVPDNDSSSGDDEELKHAAEYYAAHGTGQSSGAETPMLAPGPGPSGLMFASPTETGASSTWGGVGGGGGTATGTATGTSTGMASPTSRNATENRSRCPMPDCGRVFKDLAAHMLTHQEERPEKCPIVSCEYHLKGFARKYDKNRHALTHYRGTMACPFCPGAGTPFEKAFNRADVFKRHLTSVHNVEQTPPNTRKVPASEMVASTGAQCSICHNRFAAAQDFYEHLDECVLNTITPSGSKPPSLYSHELDQLRQAQQQQQPGPPHREGPYLPHEGASAEQYSTTGRDEPGGVAGAGEETYGHRGDRMAVD